MFVETLQISKEVKNGRSSKRCNLTTLLQRDKQTYAIVPRTPLGILTPDDLESLARVARKYQIPAIKITSDQS
jgi:NAD(P)H-nitrite reductase large subunit